MIQSSASLRVLSLLFCLVIAAPLLAQQNAESLHKHIVDQLSGAKSIRIVAKSAALKNTTVTIRAKRNNHYIMELNDRRIVCDGKTIWNYTPSKKSVVISTFDEQNASLSVEKLLLELVAVYKPVGLSSQNNSKSGSAYLLRLEPNGAARYGVKSIQLGIDKSKLNIVSVRIDSEQGAQEWSISQLQFNADIADSQFRFTPPKGVDVIDLRN